MRLVRTVVKLKGFTDSYDWSLVVPLFQLWNIGNSLILCFYLSYSATVMIDYVGCNVLIMGGFLLSWGVFYVRLHRGVVSVLDLYLVSFSYV